ncbi:undecaprenyldiphospho-muramoylpentapeptide beta-N-acetylglucosaminyltransferase [Marinivivus vitaminiproducens]|uniref:undecaprenyldiphospho-muramoylpentapeptide beta-N-acetylglucosaminyltransferase n=1 Tax=Marinivivus vitaminiproducens TaxID=3035935 RepID=UPI0027A0FD68|nr:undecaprenyldiphospho-muramoylpentapeptide beta-N-acetylglucosaminyltransferase [Geminicoccaceae bacterium SCSIO 64248]
MTAPIVIASGGTGGHMFPAIALAEVLRDRGVPVHVLTDGRGARYLADGWPCTLIEAGSPTGRPAERLAGAFRLGKGGIQALNALRGLKPAAVAAFGGYASVPPACAARLLGIPVMIHEQNAVLGKANRLVARFADRIALAFADSRGAERLSRERVTVTGNPVRPAVAAIRTHDYAPPGSGEPIEILVLGGSQGARVLSDVVPAAIAALPEALRARVRLVQQCRPEDLERVTAAYATIDFHAELSAFFADAPARLARAHLFIGRSGASTIAELLALARPSVLVPYPFAADDHQRANAQFLADQGAASMADQNGLDEALLAARLTDLLARPERLAAMSERARALDHADAADRLADTVLALAAGRDGAMALSRDAA